MKEALLYEKSRESAVLCGLCSHRCLIRPGVRGICGVRENREGVLFSLVNNRPVSACMDPIEKKPLYHFQPQSWSYSLGTVGCNFRCFWCQNYDISQWAHLQGAISRDENVSGQPTPQEFPTVPGQDIPPEEIVREALRNGCRSISYTYNEPTIFFEYALEIAHLARSAGLSNVFVTNGFMTGEMLDHFFPLLDAANVDMKGFRDRTYRRYAGARLQPVLDTLKKLKQQGVWLEVTTLVIPGINDDPAEAADMAGYIVNELGADTPWHLSRFFPAYKMKDVPLTPLATLHRFREIGLQAGIKYVYPGNVPEKSNTFCHACGELLIMRSGFFSKTVRIASDGTCEACGATIPGVDLGL